jgi:hypothetical protein
MAEKEIQFRQKREIGQVISDTFLFIKQEFRHLSKLVLIYVFPFILIYSVLQVFVMQKIVGTVVPGGDLESMMGTLWPVYKNLFVFMLFNVFVQSLYIGAVYSYIEVYLEKGKGNFKLSDVTPLLFTNSLMVLGINIVLTIIVMFGLVMCFVPGIYFANTFSLSMIILLIEKKGIGNALSKSWNMVNRQWWNTFLLNILGIVIIGVVGFIFSIPSAIAGITVSLLNVGQAEIVELPEWYWILNAVSTVVTSLLYIIPFVFLAFQYFNLDERTKPDINLPAEE